MTQRRPTSIYINPESHAYFLGMHVKAATCINGVIYLMIHIFQTAICAITYIRINQKYQAIRSFQTRSEISENSHRLIYESAHPISLILLVNITFTILAAMLIYGCVKERGSFMMPFFGVQLFSFYHNVTSFLAHLDRNVDSNKVYIGPESVHESFLVMKAFELSYHLYFIIVIMKCFKYLKLKEMTSIATTSIHIRPTFDIESGRTAPGTAIKNENVLPPDYETAIKACPPPPDYQTAVALDLQSKQKNENNINLESENNLIPSTSRGRAQPNDNGVVNLNNSHTIQVAPVFSKSNNDNQC